jgi:hypothetical protein
VEDEEKGEQILMDLSPTRKRSIKSFVKGGLDALDNEIDGFNWHPLIKDLAHNVVASLDKTANNALLDKKLLNSFEPGTVLKRQKSDEDETTTEQEPKEVLMVMTETHSDDDGGF